MPAAPVSCASGWFYLGCTEKSRGLCNVSNITMDQYSYWQIKAAAGYLRGCVQCNGREFNHGKK